MEKTQNGLPRSVGNGNSPCNPPNRPGFDGNGAVGGCGGGGALGDALLAYVYAPDQKFRLMYSAADALRHGTLFEELYKPMGVYGNE